MKFGFFARRSVFLYIRDQSFDVCFQVEIVYIQQGFAVGSLLEEFPGFVRSWFAGKCFSWFQIDLRRNLWQGLPRVFDILVLFGIKVVNFLCSGREGFQLYTRVLLGKFFRVVAVQRNDLEVPGVAVAAHGARGSPGRVMLLVVSILFLEFCLLYLLSEVISVLFLFLY